MHIPGLNAVQAQRTGFITAPNGSIMCHLYDVTDTERLADTTTPRETPVITALRSEPGECLIPELALQHATQTRDAELSAQNTARNSEGVNTDTPRPEAHAELTDFTNAFIGELSVIYRQISSSERIEPIEGVYEPAFDALTDHEEFVLRNMIGAVQARMKLPQTIISHVLSNAHRHTEMDIGADADTTATQKKFEAFESGIYTDQGLRYLPDPANIDSISVKLNTNEDAQAVMKNDDDEITAEESTDSSLWLIIDDGEDISEYPIATASNGTVSFISHEPTYGNQDIEALTGPVREQLTNAVTPNEVIDTGAFSDSTAQIIEAIHNANLTGTRTKQYLQDALVAPESTGDAQ